MTKTVFKKMVLLGRATTFLAGLAVNLRGRGILRSCATFCNPSDLAQV